MISPVIWFKLPTHWKPNSMKTKQGTVIDHAKVSTSPAFFNVLSRLCSFAMASVFTQINLVTGNSPEKVHLCALMFAMYLWNIFRVIIAAGILLMSMTALNGFVTESVNPHPNHVKESALEFMVPAARVNVKIK